MTTIEVFADIWCPFTHVGLRRLVDRRTSLGRSDVQLRVRAWPLELVNGKPMDAAFIAEEIDDLRAQVAPDLFVGFDVERFPDTSLPALMLAARAYDHSDSAGEMVSLELRDALFEQGLDIASADVLAEIAARAGVEPSSEDRATVISDWEEGRERGVVGSPHFFVGDVSTFCPSLDIERVDGVLHIENDVASFEAFVDTCFDS